MAKQRNQEKSIAEKEYDKQIRKEINNEAFIRDNIIRIMEQRSEVKLSVKKDNNDILNITIESEISRDTLRRLFGKLSTDKDGKLLLTRYITEDE